MNDFQLAVAVWIGGAVILSLLLGRGADVVSDDDVKGFMIIAGAWPILLVVAFIVLVFIIPIAPLYGALRLGMYLRARDDKKA